MNSLSAGSSAWTVCHVRGLHPESPGDPLDALHPLVDELRAPGDRRIEQELVEAPVDSLGGDRTATPENGIDHPPLGVYDVHRNIPSVDLVSVGDPSDDPFIQGQTETFDLSHHLHADRPRAHVATRRPRAIERFPVEKGNRSGSSRFPQPFKKMEGEERPRRTGADDPDFRPFFDGDHAKNPLRSFPLRFPGFPRFPLLLRHPLRYPRQPRPTAPITTISGTREILLYPLRNGTASRR